MLHIICFLLAILLGAFGSLLFVLWKGRMTEQWVVRFWHWRCLSVLSKEQQRHRLEKETMNTQSVQEKVLQETLRGLKDTEYGQRHHFKDLTDISTFRRLQPLTHYQHYKDYIKKMSQGEENILVPGRPVSLVATAGTSGCPTLVPVTANSATERFMQGTTVCLEVIHNTFPGALKKVARFSSKPNLCYSEAGIPIGPYPSSPSAKFVENLYSVPLPSNPNMTDHEVLYTQILLALRDPDLTALEAKFSWILCRVFSILETSWESMVMDIKLGCINPDLKLPQDARRQIEDLLAPDASRASELHTQFEKGFCGIARRVWPRLQMIISVGSGSSELDAHVLKNTSCQGIPLYSPIYCAAEALIGVNIWPEEDTPRYLLCPRSAFFEFIPVSASTEEQPETCCVQDVEVGEAYELVITTRDGLCRYRLGDVILVTGFHNQCPILQILFRKSQTLSVRGERITEDNFYQSLQRTVKLWPGAVLLNYCCAESGILGNFSGGSDPHYEVFVALRGVRDLSEEQRYKLDQVLQEKFPLYKSFRFKGSIGPVRVHLASPTSFFSLMELASSLSGAPLDCTQPPRTLKYRELAESIRKSVLS
ncbi:GH3 domain-containing protein [Rhinophrynus dorsalis]